MKLLLFPIRLVIKACKGTALVLALIMMFVLLMPKVSSSLSTSSQPCPHQQENALLQEQLWSLQEENDQLRSILSCEYQLLRRFEIQLLPELDWDWMTLRWFEFWDDATYRDYEQYPEGACEILWTSTLFECSLTTLERSSGQ